MLPAVSVVVPTRGRAAYLKVTLESLLRQRTDAAHELLVVHDGSDESTRRVAAEAGVRRLELEGAGGLNA
ncbi:MAG TPA: glycosyltransferase, partial [Thermoleophilaceae bacterium]|nr:glycosyltransferase [Thermoleophilaceae bacterium]